MILALTVALLLGVLSWTLTGLAPGIHINLVSAILVSSLSLFAGIPIITLVVFIVAMSITHTFIDFIPSIYLGAPDEDNFLSILPGHRMLLEGKAHEAFVLTLYGSLAALPIILIFTPIFIIFLPSFFNIIKNSIPFILIFISLFLILREKNILSSSIVFLLTGFLGYLTFNLPIKQPLMPLLSGLFGLSSLLISLKNKPTLQKQTISPLKNIKLSKKELFKTSLSASIAAPLCSFLPGIGSGHAAVLASEISKQTDKSFLFLVGSINTIVMGLSFITLYSIQKGRTGSAAAVQEILKTLSFSNLIIILLTIILSSLIAFIIGVNLSKLSSIFINKINYKYLTFLIILVLIIFNIVFSNWIGLVVLATGSFLGVYCILSNSRRISMMGCLIIPSIIYYLFN